MVEMVSIPGIMNCIIRFEDKHLFGQSYLSIISFVSIIISVLVNVIYFVLLDRFIMGAVQRRSGPYIVGWFGLLQSIADGIKL